MAHENDIEFCTWDEKHEKNLIKICTSLKMVNMLKNDKHKRALEKLEKLIDVNHIKEVEAKHQALWEGKALSELPCIVAMPPQNDWPSYPFTECWDDIEKNFITLLGEVYAGALLKDDRLYSLEPNYGCVNIPELFGVESEVTNEGNSMSKGLNDVKKIQEIIECGIPDFDSSLNKKVEEFEEFALETLSQYDTLRDTVHFNIPNIQGPFDLACLIWGRDILFALYDEPDLVEKLMDLVTDTYIQYGLYHKKRLNLPVDSAYHCAGVKLVKGGVRICNDSAVLVSGDVYRNLIKSRDIKAFKPFDGGWIHFCGNGNHFLDELFSLDLMHYLHMGNPDNHDLLKLSENAVEKNKVIVWSGSLEKIREARAITGSSRILALPENRYGGKNLNDAKMRLKRVRNWQTIEKTEW